MMVAKTISLEKCKYHFDCNENGELFWKISNSNRVNVGDVAGSLIKNTGYFYVRLEGKNYKLHRILYQFYHNVELKENEEIDHKDRNPSNNSKENLRLCDRSENNSNRKTYKNNLSTGLKNIIIMKSKNYDYYRIRIKKNRKYFYNKCFRTDRFTLEEVIEIRDEQLKIHHKDFHNFGDKL